MATSGSKKRPGSGNRRPKPAAAGGASAADRARERLQNQPSGKPRGGQAARRPQPSRRPPKKRGRSQNTTLGIFAGAFVVIAVVIIVIFSTLGGSSGNPGGITFVKTRPAPAHIVNALRNVSDSQFAAAGTGGPSVTTVGKQGSASGIVKLKGQKALTSGGKPELLYFGADYCPYCAATRWPLAVALSRFGTFHKLNITASSPIDVFSSTRTLSFAGSTYSSPYLSFNETEQTTNICPKSDIVKNPQRNTSQPVWISPAYACSTSETPLQTPTKATLALVNKYDNGTYIQTQAGSIPFILFGGKYLEISAPYGPQVLHGLSWDQIVNTFKVPGSGVGQEILGTANLYTAMICQMTHDKPGSVCKASYLKSVKQAINP